MITRFITEVHARFNPFSPRAKICRVFLAQFGPATFGGVKFNTSLLPKASTEASRLKIKFVDGKELDLDTERVGLAEVAEEVDRHSRLLSRKEKLAT